MKSSFLFSLLVLTACRDFKETGADDTGIHVQTCTWYADSDGDGYGDMAAPLEASCEAAPTGAVEDSTDCDDGDASIHLGADELCDEVDQDCDGQVDEDAVDPATWYQDADGDGFGDAATMFQACQVPSGAVDTAGDCDDNDPAYHPGATEDDCTDPNDYNCDGSVAWDDADADGFPACQDCDDSDSAVNPSAEEICDGLDNNCDGATDEDDATDASTWYQDADGDGYGRDDARTTSCAQPTGYAATGGDCDDSAADNHPGAAETCDGIDQDCDGEVDEGAVDPATWYLDADGDGFGDATSMIQACEAPSGYLADDSDCDDSDYAVNPDAEESCNGVDDDCDGATDEDEAIDASTWYLDGDGDGYGLDETSVTGCTQPTGYTATSGDCDDSAADNHPDAAETCDDIDQDCDGEVDEGAVDPATWYLDADGDGFGDATSMIQACEAPSGYLADDSDCDDTDLDVNPDAEEICDGLDNNCDGDLDEGLVGLEALCAADSCQDILADDPSAPDGDYWIYSDGAASVQTCDMTTDGGGWTLIFADDFESTPDAGWSLTSTYDCSGWSTLLGGYGVIAGGEIVISLSTLGLVHSEAWVQLEYAKLDSWDGEEAYVEVDGTTIWSQNLWYYEGAEVCGWNRGYEGSWDELHAISETTAHSAATLDLVAGSTLNQDASDESFGIDDVLVWVR